LRTDVRVALAGSAALDAFLRLPAAVYRGDPHYNATPRGGVLASLKRPEFNGRQQALVALENGEPVARLVARFSPSLKDETGRPYGMLGFFEALAGKEELVAKLFRGLIDWLHERGAGAILGPMDGDTWHRYRLNVGPFDQPPFLLEPYNPPWYEALWTAQGFKLLERYYSKRVDPAAVVAHLAPRCGEAMAAGYRLRALDPRRFRAELRRIYELSRRIFARNFLYTEISEADFLDLYAGSRALVDPDLVWFAQSPSGEDVGFLFAYPDLFRAVTAMHGQRGLLAKLRFLRHRHEAGAVNFKTLGVLPEHRRSGVAAALFHEGHRRALEKGYRIANHCLYREGNPSGDLDGGAGETLREYRLYECRMANQE
jgi:GNAT superfamily N-acetyltransferase